MPYGSCILYLLGPLPYLISHFLFSHTSSPLSSSPSSYTSPRPNLLHLPLLLHPYNLQSLPILTHPQYNQNPIAEDSDTSSGESDIYLEHTTPFHNTAKFPSLTPPYILTWVKHWVTSQSNAERVEVYINTLLHEQLCASILEPLVGSAWVLHRALMGPTDSCL